jgi:membrane protein required for colicin V production
MNWLDIFLLIVILFSVATSFLRGFARVTVGLLASIAAVVCGLWFYGMAGSWLLDYVSSKEVANLCGFLLIFVGILLLGALVGKLLAMLFKWTGLSWLDRLLGVGIGIVRGLLIATAIVMAIMAFSPKPPPHSVVGSRIAPYVIGASRVMVSLAPREVKDTFCLSYEKAKEFWQSAMRKELHALPGKEL